MTPEEVIEGLSALDMDFARRTLPGASSDVVRLVAMHKARAELLDIHPELRHASVEWLRERGYTLWRGRPLPPVGELPA
jgi:hypothetical protein